MQPPLRFVENLDRMFDGRVRCRWSDRRQEWHLEYKIAPGQIPKFYVSAIDDDAIRARDGYAHIMAVRTGDRMPCPKCGITLQVPIFKTAEVVCPSCRVQGRDGRYAACYFPLDGDALLSYIAKLDPQRGYNTAVGRQVDVANERLLASRERAFENQVEAATHDNLGRMLAIQQTGYTGKAFTGA